MVRFSKPNLSPKLESNIFIRKDPEVPKHEIKMGEIEGNWQPEKFYASKIKLIYSK